MHEILNKAMAFIANGWGFDHFTANNNQKMKQNEEEKIFPVNFLYDLRPRWVNFYAKQLFFGPFYG